MILIPPQMTSIPLQMSQLLNFLLINNPQLSDLSTMKYIYDYIFHFQYKASLPLNEKIDAKDFYETPLF